MSEKGQKPTCRPPAYTDLPLLWAAIRAERQARRSHIIVPAGTARVIIAARLSSSRTQTFCCGKRRRVGLRWESVFVNAGHSLALGHECATAKGGLD